MIATSGLVVGEIAAAAQLVRARWIGWPAPCSVACSGAIGRVADVALAAA
jgi:hypothetical protein